MRSAICLILGIAIGSAMQPSSDQQREIISLNHVAIAVSDVDATARLYSESMGFPQAFAFKDPDGSPTLAYFQINRNTFIELLPVTSERPAGLVHFGLEVMQLDSLVRKLRTAGLQVRDPAVSPRTGSRIAVARTTQGTDIELLEFGPESLHRKVMDAWQ